jgi:hypothetical protein
MIETLFLHESGEQMSAGKLFMPATKFDPQGFGSALSYARRYSLMAACGIAPEDDDANHAVKSTYAAQARAVPKNTAPTSNVATPNASVQEDRKAQATPTEQQEPIPKAVESAPTQAPPKMQGSSDQWQLKISVDPNTHMADWIDIVTDSSVFMLDMAQNKNDTNNIFRVNANIYNHLKLHDMVAYDKLINQFKAYKEKLND